MPTAPSTGKTAVRELPPLILHPFNERVSPSALLENSKAALMISGLIPPDGATEEELERRVLAGRFSEVRMLYFLGKDVMRWIEQCVEWAERGPEFAGADLVAQSFAALIAFHPPAAVREKLTLWGVADSASIFSRAIGLNVLFAQPPAFEALTEEFLAGYHRYADALYRAFLGAQAYPVMAAEEFHFELYASGEYSRLLESKWSAE